MHVIGWWHLHAKTTRSRRCLSQVFVDQPAFLSKRMCEFHSICVVLWPHVQKTEQAQQQHNSKLTDQKQKSGPEGNALDAHSPHCQKQLALCLILIKIQFCWAMPRLQPPPSSLRVVTFHFLGSGPFLCHPLCWLEQIFSMSWPEPESVCQILFKNFFKCQLQEPPCSL